MSRGYSFSKSLTFITSDSQITVSETVIIMLTMIIKIMNYCIEWYGQLLLKYLKIIQQMQSFFSQHYLITFFKTQLTHDYFWIFALTAATLVSSHFIWFEDWEAVIVTAECWIFYVTLWTAFLWSFYWYNSLSACCICFMYSLNKVLLEINRT